MIRHPLPLLLLLASFALHAQTPPPPSPSPPATTRFFSIFVWPTEGVLADDARIAPLPRVFYPGINGQDTQLQLVRNAATPLTTYTGPLPLELFSLREIWQDPPENAPPGTPPTVTLERQPRIRAEFPPQWTRVQLIVFPDRVQADGTLLTVAVPFDQDRVQPGMARIFNTTQQTFLLEFPDLDRTVPLPPGQPLDFDPRRTTDTGFLRIFVHRRNPQGAAEMVHTSRLFLHPEQRNLFFLYPQNERRVRILRIAGHPGDPVAP